MPTTIKINPPKPKVGDNIAFKIEDGAEANRWTWTVGPSGDKPIIEDHTGEPEFKWPSEGQEPGEYLVTVTLHHDDDQLERLEDGFILQAAAQQNSGAAEASAPPPPDTRRRPIPVTLQRSQNPETEDIALWATILRSTKGLSFERYYSAMQELLCPTKDKGGEKRGSGNALAQTREDLREELNVIRSLPFNDADAYRLLKVATEAFVLANVQSLGDIAFTKEDAKKVSQRLGTVLNQDALKDLLDNYLVADKRRPKLHYLPYLGLVRDKLKDQRIKAPVASSIPGWQAFPQGCEGILEDRLTRPLLIELIWSYWQEEGMLVQTMNTISRRFQNIRGPSERDPLANLEIDPLRPLNNLLWGYIQDEQHRLTLRRRTYEYDHHYGINLQGRAVGNLHPADTRSKFLEAFHSLLYLATLFYQQDDDTTVVADGFPLMNALRDVHMILSEGAHNQFGDLPSTARQEMLVQQWLLARPEFREFLPTRVMVAYPELWMDRVDAMKALQGWTDTSVLHFRNLAQYGEPLLLSIRYGGWSKDNLALQATNWARFWRQEIQGYIYAYRTVTGVDLSAEITDSPHATGRNLPPAIHLQRQLEQQRRGALPAGTPAAELQLPARSRGRLPR